MKRHYVAATTAALLLSVAANAQMQGQQPQPQGDILQQMLGAMFGNSPQASDQTLESDWNQGRRPFGQRREQLDARIDAAVRDGSMSRGEANQMRAEYDDIVRLEEQYSADGSVSPQQRADLRGRYRALSQRVGNDNYGQGSSQAQYDQPGYGQSGYQPSGPDGRWLPLSSRSTAFEQRLNAGLRKGTLSQAETTRLRSDWRALAQVEAGYQRGGIDAREQADLWARYRAIDSRLDGNAGNWAQLDPRRWSQLETRLVTAERGGRISRDMAMMVRDQLSDLARLDAVYAVGGYNPDQRSYLGRRYADMLGLLGGR
jgi:hypothetical protein